MGADVFAFLSSILIAKQISRPLKKTGRALPTDSPLSVQTCKHKVVGAMDLILSVL